MLKILYVNSWSKVFIIIQFVFFIGGTVQAINLNDPLASSMFSFALGIMFALRIGKKAALTFVAGRSLDNKMLMSQQKIIKMQQAQIDLLKEIKQIKEEMNQ